MVKSQPVLPLRALSGSVVIQWQGSVAVAVSVAHITNKDHGDVPGLGSHLGQP